MADFIFIVVAALIIYLLFFRKRGARAEEMPIGQLRGTGDYLFDIVGESKYQSALEQICGGRTDDSAQKFVQAQLHLEDSNPYDNQAVRVDISGLTVGYLSRQDARSYRRQLEQLGHKRLIGVCDAMIVGGWDRGRADMGHFGVKLDLPVKHGP